MTLATDPELDTGSDDTVEDLEDNDSEPDSGLESGELAPHSTKAGRTLRHAILFGLATVIALSGLVGWIGFRAHQSHHVQAQRNLYLQVARQGALNLTTIDWQHADADVHRILDGATGEFYDDFAKRSQPFIDVLKQAKAKTVGTITEAGLESQAADTARALVAVSVLTSNAGQSDQAPRQWRMRIDVQKIGDQVKVANVGFVP